MQLHDNISLSCYHFILFVFDVNIFCYNASPTCIFLPAIKPVIQVMCYVKVNFARIHKTEVGLFDVNKCIY